LKDQNAHIRNTLREECNAIQQRCRNTKQCL